MIVSSAAGNQGSASSRPAFVGSRACTEPVAVEGTNQGSPVPPLSISHTGWSVVPHVTVPAVQDGDVRPADSADGFPQLADSRVSQPLSICPHFTHMPPSATPYVARDAFSFAPIQVPPPHPRAPTPPRPSSAPSLTNHHPFLPPLPSRRFISSHPIVNEHVTGGAAFPASHHSPRTTHPRFLPGSFPEDDIFFRIPLSLLLTPPGTIVQLPYVLPASVMSSLVPPETMAGSSHAPSLKQGHGLPSPDLSTPVTKIVRRLMIIFCFSVHVGYLDMHGWATGLLSGDDA